MTSTSCNDIHDIWYVIWNYILERVFVWWGQEPTTMLQLVALMESVLFAPLLSSPFT